MTIDTAGWGKERPRTTHSSRPGRCRPRPPNVVSVRGLVWVFIPFSITATRHDPQIGREVPLSPPLPNPCLPPSHTTMLAATKHARAAAPTRGARAAARPAVRAATAPRRPPGAAPAAPASPIATAVRPTVRAAAMQRPAAGASVAAAAAAAALSLSLLLGAGLAPPPAAAAAPAEPATAEEKEALVSQQRAEIEFKLEQSEIARRAELAGK
jgi:hypothetical protein